jgi:UDP-glucose 4-epimerase
MDFNKKILVTGGAGFIGTHLCKALVESGFNVVVLDLKNPKTKIENVKYVVGDARDFSTVFSIVKDVDFIFHLAALVSVPLCEKDPIESYSHNFFATLNVLESIRKVSVEGKKVKLVFSSSAAVYGNIGSLNKGLSEEQVERNFMSFYAAQKYASEQAILQYYRCFNVESLIFRFFNVYGEGQDPTSPYSGVISIFTKKALLGETLDLHGDGNQTRDFISVHDIVLALTSTLKKEVLEKKDIWCGSAINLGTGESVSIKELSKIILKITKSRSKVESAPQRIGDVMYSKADIKKAKELLNFEPKIKLEDGLRHLIKSLT